MNKKYIVLIAGLVVVLGAFGFIYWQKQSATTVAPAPVVTEQQENRYQEGINKADAGIQKNPREIFGYLDKAEYLRQLDKEQEALAVLAEAYKIQPDWQNTPDFMIVEARIYGQADAPKAIERYEKLLEREPLNQSLYSEYISFLKRSNQPRSKVVDWYERVIAKIPDTYLRDEYKQFLENPPK